MKHTSYFPFLIILLCFSQITFAQLVNRTWISGGATYGGFIGEGEKGNTFDQNAGFKFEFGSKGQGNWGFIWYSFSGYNSVNHLKESSVDTKFKHHIWELRYFFGEKKFQPYLSFGIGVGTMKLEGMEGVDRFTVIPFGGGAHYIFERVLIDAYFKPFSAAKNQLGHNFGYEAGILVGYIF